MITEGNIYGQYVRLTTKEEHEVLDMFFEFHSLFKLYELDKETFSRGDLNPNHNYSITTYYYQPNKWNQELRS